MSFFSENLYDSEVKEQDHKQRTAGEREEGMGNAIKGAHIEVTDIKTKKRRKKIKQIAAAEEIRTRKETAKTAQDWGKILIEAEALDEPWVNEGWLATGEKSLEVETMIQSREGILRQNEDDATRPKPDEGEAMVLEAGKKMRDTVRRFEELLRMAKEQVEELEKLFAEGKRDPDSEIQEKETSSEEGHKNDESQDAEVGDKKLEDDTTTLDDKRTEVKAEEEDIDGEMFLIGEDNVASG